MTIVAEGAWAWVIALSGRYDRGHPGGFGRASAQGVSAVDFSVRHGVREGRRGEDFLLGCRRFCRR